MFLLSYNYYIVFILVILYASPLRLRQYLQVKQDFDSASFQLLQTAKFPSPASKLIFFRGCRSFSVDSFFCSSGSLKFEGIAVVDKAIPEELVVRSSRICHRTSGEPLVTTISSFFLELKCDLKYYSLLFFKLFK